MLSKSWSALIHFLGCKINRGLCIFKTAKVVWRFFNLNSDILRRGTFLNLGMLLMTVQEKNDKSIFALVLGGIYDYCEVEMFIKAFRSNS